MKYLLFSALFVCTFMACSPQPTDMVGTYLVSAEIKESTLKREDIKKQIKEALSKAGEDIEKSRQEMMEDLDLENIDTSTFEGKMEYLGKSFGAQLGNLGINLGKASQDFGSFIAEIADGSLNFTTSLLKNIEFQVELQEDGDVKVKNKLTSFGMNDSKWRVENGEFILSNSNDKEESRFKIKDRSSNGFVLEKDEVLLHFNKAEK